MRVTLRINDKTYNYSSSISKRKMMAAISRLERENPHLKGTCVVHYSVQYKNEFDFDSPMDLREKLTPCLEEDLIREFTKKTS